MTTLQFRRFPLIRIFISYCLGIISYGFVHENLDWLPNTCFLLTYSVLCLGVMCCLFQNRRRSLVIGCIIHCFSFILGAFNFSFQYQSSYCQECESVTNKAIGTYAIVCDRAYFNSAKTIINIPILIVSESPESKNSNMKFLAQLEAQELSPSAFIIGDVFCMEGTLRRIPKNINPHSFDYQKYLKLQGYEYTLSVSTYSVYDQAKKSVSRFIHRAQVKAVLILNTYIKDDVAASLATAMVLGYKEDLSDGLESTFRNTGTAHVIAVSGLHVDIIALFILFLIGKANKKNRFFYIIQCASPICLIICYAMLVGNSPSVNRAAIMYSFLFASKILNRSYNIWNILCITALVLLVIRPGDLYHVGFQFSFVAVASIVLFYPLLAPLNKARHLLTRTIIDAMLVSIAVQILITPLSIYYFHFFPLCFILTNSFLIIFIYLIIFGSILILLSSIISPSFSRIIGNFVESSIYSLQKLLLSVQNIPHATLENLYLSQFELCLIYGQILSVILVLDKPDYNRLKCSLLLILMFSCIHTVSHTLQNNQACITIYNCPGNILIDFIYQHECYTYSKNNREYPFHTTNNRIAHQVQSVYQLNQLENFDGMYLAKRNDLIQFLNHRLSINSSTHKNFLEDNIISITDTSIYVPNLTSSISIQNRNQKSLKRNTEHALKQNSPIVIDISI